MPVDTSMYNTKPAAPVNPLQMMSSVVALKQGLMQNQLLQRTMGAQQAVGEAAQGATGDDGSFDPNAYAAAVKANPAAAAMAPEALAYAQQQRQAQLAQQGAELEMAMKRVGFMANSLGSLADTPGVTAKDVTSLAGTLVKDGVIPAKMAATELQGMPTDGAQIPAYLRGLQKRAMDSVQQIGLYHAKTMADLGSIVQPVNTSPLGEQEALAKSLSPEAAASPVAGPVDASGAPTTVPLGQRVAMGVVKTGLSPKEAAAQGTMGAGVAQDALTFENAARTAPDMAAALKNMTGDLKQLSTGPGSHNRNSFMAAVNSFMGTGFDAEKVATQEGFDKLAAQVAARQRQMLGMSTTDAQTSMIAAASPGSQLSKLGNANQIAIIKGNNDALVAENRAWERYKASGKGSETFHQFTTVFNKHVDPLVFQMQYMTDAQKKALVGAMSASEKDRLAQSMAFARHNGLLSQ